MLSNLPNGTFLIRVSNAGTRRGEHALSIRFDLPFYLLITFLLLCFLTSFIERISGNASAACCILQ